MLAQRALRMILLLLLHAGCACHERTSSAESFQPIASPNGAKEYPSKLGKITSQRDIWPVPDDATRWQTGIATKVIHPSHSTAHPQVGRRHVLGIAYVAYDQTGRVTARVPFKVQDLDLAPRGWQEVLTHMTRGEVRRAWIPRPDGGTDILDIEIQEFVVVRGDGTTQDVK